MPLVRIDVLRGRSEQELTQIGTCVHEAMNAELGVPERDRFQLLTEHEPGRLHFDPSYLDIERSDASVLVQRRSQLPDPPARGVAIDATPVSPWWRRGSGRR
jgi:hypothetical protein